MRFIQRLRMPGLLSFPPDMVRAGGEDSESSGDGQAAREATLTWETLTALAAHTQPSMARSPGCKSGCYHRADESP